MSDQFAKETQVSFGSINNHIVNFGYNANNIMAIPITVIKILPSFTFSFSEALGLIYRCKGY